MDVDNGSFDDLLCRLISMFRKYRLYDDRIEEENALKLLREAEHIASESKDLVCVAKMGCVIEYLVHRFYIADDTDIALREVDALLTTFKKELKHPSAEVFASSLWIGEYFLFRFKSPNSRAGRRSKKMISEILSFMTKSINKADRHSPLLFPSNELFEETVDWVKELCDAHICERQVVALLKKLYSIQAKGVMQQEVGEKSALRQQLRNTSL